MCTSELQLVPSPPARGARIETLRGLRAVARLRELAATFRYFRPFQPLEPLILLGALVKTACSADLGGCGLRIVAILISHHVSSLLETAQGWQTTPLLERRGKPATP